MLPSDFDKEIGYAQTPNGCAQPRPPLAEEW
jgi:hypothetical protein